MGLKRKPGWILGSTVTIIPRLSRNVQIKLTANGQVIVVWYIVGHPDGGAEGISIIAALRRVWRTIQISMKIQLFAWIIFMDISSTTFDVINRVLDTIYASCDGVLCHADTVSKTPA